MLSVFPPPRSAFRIPRFPDVHPEKKVCPFPPNDLQRFPASKTARFCTFRAYI